MKKVVGRGEFDAVVERLKEAPRLALDTETYGLRPYHGDRLFSAIIAAGRDEGYYFNFQAYDDLGAEWVLSPSHLERLRLHLFCDSQKLWFLQNAKFDMAILAQDNCFLAGEIHCTKAIGRVEYNEHFSYDLDAALKRIGMAKDEGPEKWIEENHAWEWVTVPGRKKRDKNKFYFKVPFPIISSYGLDDACGTFALGESQVESIARKSREILSQNSKARVVEEVLANERRLTHTVFRIEHHGVLIDPDYCKKAAAREDQLLNDKFTEFEKSTGKKYISNSQPLFKEVFASDKERWEFGKPTKTGQINPTFESEVLAGFVNPVAKTVLAIRDHESRSRFYHGFLYHADKRNYVHPNFNPDGAVHGRFSSSSPNFQNLTSENVQVCLACKHEHEEVLQECEKCGSKELARKEWLIRQAIIPPPGFDIWSFDYKAMEYYFMLEYACEQVGYITPLAERVREGADVHQATADLATGRAGFEIKRSPAKTSNFLTIYGGGDQKLADQLGIPLEKARAIRRAILDASPEIDVLIRAVIKAAERRGYVRNWMGRMNYFPDTRWAYRAPNYLIAGGCADVVKLAMNRIDDLLVGHKTKMVLTVHDELDFYGAHGEEFLIPRIKTIMEEAFPAKYLPLKVSVSTSKTSLADLEAWAG